ncbi:hypothetical protein H310_01770 [Aphanomyces invadans]|uniref:FYVE-type domain-containing protein n=1 Tax=Aphanomyces invadans TaxID=157072 RepID=A0A024UL15_9STRA|nr:hypothetical protein H310_01770 [Aphanomyces invadans]ETW07141.1 hypothetical protein H310_01770 [Aphanomyces invadans]|eukprot:XP_008863234.1 hypothetical protein H310_01770 [Aphanomyces invadans]
MQRRRLAHPLPTDFFKCPNLTQSETDALIQTGVGALKHLVLHARLDDSSPYMWKLERATQDLQVYVGSDLSKAKSDVVFMSVTELHATLDEAAALLECDTNESYRTFMQRYNKDVIDCAMLTTLAPRTPEYPRNYIGLKWFVQGAPTPYRNRDFCVLECCDDFSLQGARGWARVLHSVDVDWVPSLYNAMGIVRAVFQACGTVFLETNRPGVLKAAQIYHVDLKGNFPKWILRLGIKQRARTLADMDAYFRAQRMTRMTILPQPDEMTSHHHGHKPPQDLLDIGLSLDRAANAPLSTSWVCDGCRVALSRHRTQFKCRRCGQIMCRQCCHPWEQPSTTRHGPRPCLCYPCSSVPTGTASSSASPSHSVDRPPEPLRRIPRASSTGHTRPWNEMLHDALSSSMHDQPYVSRFHEQQSSGYAHPESSPWLRSPTTECDEERYDGEWYEPIALHDDSDDDAKRPHADPVYVLGDNISIVCSENDSNCIKL